MSERGKNNETIIKIASEKIKKNSISNQLKRYNETMLLQNQTAKGMKKDIKANDKRRINSIYIDYKRKLYGCN